MGRVPALSPGVPIRIRFAPQHPMNYCRRVTVLVEDALPLFCDLLGTGYVRAKVRGGGRGPGGGLWREAQGEKAPSHPSRSPG